MVKVEFFITFDLSFLVKEIFVYDFLLNSVFTHPLKKNLMGSTALRGEKESK